MKNTVTNGNVDKSRTNLKKWKKKRQILLVNMRPGEILKLTDKLGNEITNKTTELSKLKGGGSGPGSTK